MEGVDEHEAVEIPNGIAALAPVAAVPTAENEQFDVEPEMENAFAV